MNTYEEGLKLIEEKFGNGKDNIVSVATIALEPGAGGTPRPVVRDVDACYDNGVFYVTTHRKSRKMQQIENNPNVAFSVCCEWLNGVGTGENLGWVLDPKNDEIRSKLRAAFVWYDAVNNEKDENSCILAIRIKKATLNINHWEKLYHMDFETKTIMENWGIV